MSNFYLDVIQKDPRFQSPAECRDVALLEPVTRAAVAAIITDAASQGITLEISETYRSPARQKLLFDQGATQLENVGVHGYGLACDFFKMIDGKASWAGDWTFLRDLAAKHGMVSGVDWGEPGIAHDFIDSDHVQRIRVNQQESLFSGDWYPDAEMTVS
jgi:hypothetical protein